MRAGDTLRFRGPAGAHFVVTVGGVFGERLIRAYVESGEWTPVDEPALQPQPKRRAARKRTAKKPPVDE